MSDKKEYNSTEEKVDYLMDRHAENDIIQQVSYLAHSANTKSSVLNETVKSQKQDIENVKESIRELKQSNKRFHERMDDIREAVTKGHEYVTEKITEVKNDFLKYQKTTNGDIAKYIRWAFGFSGGILLALLTAIGLIITVILK